MMRLRQNLIESALRCFRTSDARDFARDDTKLDENNGCNFIEADLVPGMTEGSSHFSKAFEIDKDMGDAEVIRLMLKNAMTGYLKKRKGRKKIGHSSLLNSDVF